jgi:hypothetical protein
LLSCPLFTIKRYLTCYKFFSSRSPQAQKNVFTICSISQISYGINVPSRYTSMGFFSNIGHLVPKTLQIISFTITVGSVLSEIDSALAHCTQKSFLRQSKPKKTKSNKFHFSLRFLKKIQNISCLCTLINCREYNDNKRPLNNAFLRSKNTRVL